MTRLLLDTHLVLWWLNGDPRLPQPVVERVQAPEAEMFVSQVPFDRLLVCQSRVEPMLLLSVDSQLLHLGANGQGFDGSRET